MNYKLASSVDIKTEPKKVFHVREKQQQRSKVKTHHSCCKNQRRSSNLELHKNRDTQYDASCPLSRMIQRMRRRRRVINFKVVSLCYNRRFCAVTSQFSIVATHQWYSLCQCCRYLLHTEQAKNAKLAYEKASVQSSCI